MKPRRKYVFELTAWEIVGLVVLMQLARLLGLIVWQEFFA